MEYTHDGGHVPDIYSMGRKMVDYVCYEMPAKEKRRENRSI